MKIGPPEKYLGQYDLSTHAKLGLAKYLRRMERYYYQGIDGQFEMTEHDRASFQAMCILSISEMIEKRRRTEIALSLITTALNAIWFILLLIE